EGHAMNRVESEATAPGLGALGVERDGERKHRAAANQPRSANDELGRNVINCPTLIALPPLSPVSAQRRGLANDVGHGREACHRRYNPARSSVPGGRCWVQMLGAFTVARCGVRHVGGSILVALTLGVAHTVVAQTPAKIAVTSSTLKEGETIP